MDQMWDRIEAVAKANNSFILTSQVEALGICRPMLKKYSDAGKLERIRKGLYILSGELPDEYALLQLRSKYAVFSYGTALYVWGLSDRAPHIYDITLPRGTNINFLKKDIPNLRCHYVQQEIYELGITEVRSPQGAMVKVYDRERCICDLIRDKDHMDMQLFTRAIKDYFKSNPNNRKLLKYSKIFDIEEKVRTYMEVL